MTRSVRRLGCACTLVFLDPPYGAGLIPRALAALAAAGWLAPGALLVAEVGRDEPSPFAERLVARAHGAARIEARATDHRTFTLWRNGRVRSGRVIENEGSSMPRLRTALLLSAALTPIGAWASPLPFTPGDLVVATSTYTGNASTVTVGQPCPAAAPRSRTGPIPACSPIPGRTAASASRRPITLSEITPSGTSVGSFTLPTSQIVTSFSSKSEMALNLSTNGSALTIMGYQAPVNALDVSNSNTPGAVDPTNPVTVGPYNRAVAQINANGTVQVTPVDAYSGNNGRAAILANGQYYMVGNAGNGSNPEPASVAGQAGVQLGAPGQTATQRSAISASPR